MNLAGDLRKLRASTLLLFHLYEELLLSDHFGAGTYYLHSIPTSS